MILLYRAFPWFLRQFVGGRLLDTGRSFTLHFGGGGGGGGRLFESGRLLDHLQYLGLLKMFLSHVHYMLCQWALQWTQ